MKISEIKTGETYVNRGAGKTARTVIAIGDEHRPNKFYSMNPPPDEPGVLFRQNGMLRSLYLSSFASWAGRVF